MTNFIRRQWGGMSIALGFGIAGLFSHRGLTSIVVAILLAGWCIWVYDHEGRENKRLRERNDWVMAKANKALEFAANAEVALQAMAERHHEAEMAIAGVSIPKSIWIDGVRIPVEDADEDDLELGSQL